MYTLKILQLKETFSIKLKCSLPRVDHSFLVWKSKLKGIFIVLLLPSLEHY